VTYSQDPVSTASGGEQMQKDKAENTGYGPFGFYNYHEIPVRPCFGYERQIEAGMGLCLNVLENGNASLLVFGLPGTGKTLYPCTLANRFNKISKKKLSLAYIQCGPQYHSTPDFSMQKFFAFMKMIQRHSPLIIHLVELDSIERPCANLENPEQKFKSFSLLRFLRTDFSEGFDKSLIVATATNPAQIDPELFNDIDNVFYIPPTGRSDVATMISQLLERVDSEEIAAKLGKSFSRFGMIPLGRNVLRACKLINQQYKNIDNFSADEVVSLLKLLITPFPSSRVDEYEQQNEPLRAKCELEMRYWHDFFQSKSSQHHQNGLIPCNQDSSDSSA
jgi:hypothetical protein